jgi:gamma-glutamyl-gamma-aminobutyraldehyde dehydrogenase
VQVLSPRDGKVIASVDEASPDDVDRAVRAGRRAFDQGPWPQLPARERASVLFRLADLVEASAEELARTISLEMGKPLRDSLGIEVPAVAKTFRWHAELADKVPGEVTQSSSSALALVTREPAGVVGAVVPWNFPLTMAAWKLAPALIAGCTVVLKPAEQSPLSALLLADSNLKRVWLELGGKSPNIVFPDAYDLDAAAWGIFFNSGEMCTAASRLLVHRDIADDFIRPRVALSGTSNAGFGHPEIHLRCLSRGA